MTWRDATARDHRAKRPLIVVLVVCVACALLASVEPTGAATTLTTSAALGSRLGVFPGYAATTRLERFERWLGRPSRFVVQFADQHEERFLGSIWGQVVKAGALGSRANTTTLIESIPLAFDVNLDASTEAGRARVQENLSKTVSGAYDPMYRSAAEMLHNHGFGDAVVRLGWEFDGTWFPWSAVDNCSSYVAAFRHVHDVFTSVSPEFTFDWSAMLGVPADIAPCAWPGDHYVDMVGLDVYDKDLDVAFDPRTSTWADPKQAFRTAVLPSLRRQQAFAVAHGKPVSYPEWGLTGHRGRAAGTSGGDDVAFVQGMYDWMTSLPKTGPGHVAYQSYFDWSDREEVHGLAAFPRARARFRALFGE